MTNFARRIGHLVGILALPLLFVVVDVVLDKGTSFLTWSRSSWQVWCTGFVWDVSAWLSFLWLASRLISHPKPAVCRVGWALVWGDSLALSVASLVSAAYQAEYHHLPNIHALYFAIAEWRNSVTLAREYIDPRALLALFIAVPFLVMLHRLALVSRSKLAPPSTNRFVRYAGLAPVFVAMGIAPLALGWHRFQQPLPLLANWSRIFFQAGLGAFGNKTNLQTPSRMALAPGKPTWNVILLLNESLRADAFESGLRLIDSLDPQKLAPHMSAWSRSPEVFVFAKGRSNSTATSVSVPSLITGVSASGTTFEYHRNPTLFTAAKAAGLHTFLLTSQDWHWEHFDEFAFGGIDHVVHRSSFAAERNNDLGVDDSLILDSLPALLSAPGKFFGMIQLNSNHGPFWPGPTRTDLPLSSRERYLASVEYVDHVLDRILQVLERDPRWDSTLVFLVSDHAENIGARKLGRINSFYEETVRIPFMARIPPAYRSHQREVDALHSWLEHPVQLLDLMPTLLDLWEIPLAQGNGFVTGSSLIRPSVTGRVQGGQNTGDIRSWDVEGLYLVRDEWKFVLTQGRQPGLFDLSNDSREEHSLWDSVPIRQTQLEWIRAAMRDPIRQGVCQRAGESCPIELRTP